MEHGRELAPGSVIADQWRIDGMLGAGGFGVTYDARHVRDGRRAALKEYLPFGCGTRAERSMAVRSAPGKEGDIFKWGLDRFLKEAETVSPRMPCSVSVTSRSTLIGTSMPRIFSS